MSGEFTFDGRNSYTTYKVVLAENALAAIAEYAPLKAPDFNNWHEEDGIEVDLSAPALDTRTLSIPFVCADSEQVGAFIEDLSAASYRWFTFPGIPGQKWLRFVAQRSRMSRGKLQFFTLDFADDYPLEGYAYATPTGTKVTGYVLDEYDLGMYGITPLFGIDDEIRKSPDVKQNNSVNLKASPGVFYDNADVKYEAMEVALPLLMNASDVEEFWSFYNAFLYDLTRANERQLFVDKTSDTYPCYYKSSACKRMVVLPNGAVWCEFDITLVFTRGRVLHTDYVLATEDGKLVTEQTGINFINLNSDGR